jgi:CP family cyanate transporter-like MFS transporter
MPNATRTTGTEKTFTRKDLLLPVAALLLAGVNLRPAVTSLGPVLEEVRRGTGMSATAAGVLTALPALCFALGGLVAPRLARRRGPVTAVAAALLVLAAGLAVRPLAAGAALFVALTAVALAGIAVVNVLLPAVVRRYFPERVGTMTGAYAMALNLGASTAAAVTVPIAAWSGGWRIGLGCWALLAVLAVPGWFLLARSRSTAPPLAEPTGPGPASWRSGAAWALAVYFGLQATAAYVVIGWLPQVFRDAGVPAARAGVLFAVTSLLGVPLSFVLSAVAGRVRGRHGQGWLAVGLGVFGLAGYAGLVAAPAAGAWLWAVLLGVANCSFPLALTMIGTRGRDGGSVVRLSGFTQGVGYLLSVPGPVAVGALYQYTGGWTAPLGLLCALMVAQLGAGFLAGRRPTVTARQAGQSRP